MKNRIILDTNVMVSFLIGKRLQRLKDQLSDSSIILIFTDQLISELQLVTTRPKFRKHFEKRDVTELINLISILGLNYQIQTVPQICRDPKDNFLLGLCEMGKADYLITGDNDLLELAEYGGTKILKAIEFEDLL